jgi:hypothetical protein
LYNSSRSATEHSCKQGISVGDESHRFFFRHDWNSETILFLESAAADLVRDLRT